MELVKTDRKRAAEIYSGGEQGEHQPRRVDRNPQKPNMNYSAAPLGLPQAAQFFSRTGSIKQKPTDWKEFFFPEMHDLNGS